MNNGITIQEALARKPFQPVRLYLKDGRIFEILGRRYAVLGSKDIVVGRQASDEADGICSSISMVPISEINRVELLPLPTPA